MNKNFIRKMLMMQEGEKAVYPLKNGRYDFTQFTNCYIIVTNGNHVLYNFGNYDSNKSSFLYISDVNAINGTIPNNSSAGAHSKVFSVNSGDEIILKIKNIEYQGTNISNITIAAYMRVANTNNVNIFRMPDTLVADNELIYTTTIEQTVDSGGLYIILTKLQNNRIIQFDIELYINGERYV